MRVNNKDYYEDCDEYETSHKDQEVLDELISRLAGELLLNSNALLYLDVNHVTATGSTGMIDNKTLEIKIKEQEEDENFNGGNLKIENVNKKVSSRAANGSNTLLSDCGIT